ncbi:MAG: septal ring lytic transglycosylase RlpA family protein [Desulfobulbaceae bacterium]|nr:septal ring lytic transglycosylase RlpA family protein [Desulfobulbaceae bacterium]
MMIGLAIIEFSIVQSSNAATSAMKPKPSVASAQQTRSSAAIKAKANKSMKGLAAVYSDKFNGRKTASGQKFSQSQLTAAHRALPLGTNVRVTNLRNNQSVEVRINDRGPFHGSRVIDLSTAAAAEVGMKKTGIALVQLEVISKPPTKNS